MVIILSFNSLDEPTNDLIEWLKLKKTKFLRINGSDFKSPNKITLNLSEKSFIINNKKYFENDISVVWYRRWNEPNNEKSIHEIIKENELDVNESIFLSRYRKYLKSESISAYNSFFNMFPKEKWIPHYSKSRGGLEKSEVLYIALEVGLEIPNTIITNNKNELENFTSKFNKIITKSIRNVEVITYKNYSLDVYTKILTLKEVQNLPEIFNYAKFQEYVEKDFEIRVFFIDDYIYSMAIFSQNDTMTKVDFRNYNISKPNRFVPFKLPKIIEEKLLVLTRKLGLRTGSFDLIYNSHKDKYYFLEVNPVGQFGMVSYNCNEPIEEKIADILTEINNKYISGKRYQENC